MNKQLLNEYYEYTRTHKSVKEVVQLIVQDIRESQPFDFSHLKFEDIREHTKGMRQGFVQMMLEGYNDRKEPYFECVSNERDILFFTIHLVDAFNTNYASNPDAGDNFIYYLWLLKYIRYYPQLNSKEAYFTRYISKAIRFIEESYDIRILTILKSFYLETVKHDLFNVYKKKRVNNAYLESVSLYDLKCMPEKFDISFEPECEFEIEDSNDVNLYLEEELMGVPEGNYETIKNKLFGKLLYSNRVEWRIYDHLKYMDVKRKIREELRDVSKKIRKLKTHYHCLQNFDENDYEWHILQ